MEVEATQHLDRFAPVAAAPPAGEHTVMLSSREISEQLWSGQGHDPDEAKPDATMMLLVPESAAPPSRAPSKAARFVQEQLGTLRSGSAPLAGPIHDPAPPVVPVVTGRTERMSPEEVRMLRLAGLGGNVSASPSPVRTPEPVVEATQVLEVVEDADLEERQTTTFSPEQVRAFRRAYEADPGPGEGR